MIRSLLTVSSGTLASRLLGFARDSMIAALLGASPVADAFLVAFQLVNVIRRLLAEGALNAALVPAWLAVRDAEGAVAAAAFAGRILATVSAALLAAFVQRDADRGDDGAARQATGPGDCCAGDRGHGRSGRAAATWNSDFSPWCGCRHSAADRIRRADARLCRDGNSGNDCELRTA